MALARPRAWRQVDQIDAEVCETAGIAEGAFDAFAGELVERRRVCRALAREHGHRIEFWHAVDLYRQGINFAIVRP